MDNILFYRQSRYLNFLGGFIRLDLYNSCYRCTHICRKHCRYHPGNGSQYITVDGKERHVISHLKDFLFSPQRCRTPVHILSGGEKKRLLLAKLFSRPANVLVLDEPTNDLDIETLELLEEMLFHFKGTILLVSHDRAFLNNVVTSTLVFEAPGQLVEYAGGYDDWLLQREGTEKTQIDKPGRPAAKPIAKPAPKCPKRITFREKQELEGLYEKIEALETEYEECALSSLPPTFITGRGRNRQDERTRIDRVSEANHDLIR